MIDARERLIEDAVRKLEALETKEISKNIQGRLQLNTNKVNKEDECKDAMFPKACEYWRDRWK